MKTLAILLALATPATAQYYGRSLRSIGGDGTVDVSKPKKKDDAPNLRANMRNLPDAKVIKRQEVDGQTWIQVESGGKNYWVADYPEAKFAGVGRSLPCVVVVGPANDAIDGHNVYYWFASGTWDVNYVRAFQQRRPGVPLD